MWTESMAFFIGMPEIFRDYLIKIVVSHVQIDFCQSRFIICGCLFKFCLLIADIPQSGEGEEADLAIIERFHKRSEHKRTGAAVYPG